MENHSREKDSQVNHSQVNHSQANQVHLLFNYFKLNSGLALSISYLLLTLCGLFYSVALYREFEINILQFAEISDLLIVGISDPMAIVMFGGGLLVAFSTDRLYSYSRKVREKWLGKPKAFKRTIILLLNYVPKEPIGLLSGLIFVFITYGFLFVTLFAEWRADEIKEGNGELYSIIDETSSRPQEFVLLGTTTNYVLLYDPKPLQIQIIPVDKIVRMNPILNKPEGE